MKKIVSGCIILCLFALYPFNVTANDAIAQADAVYTVFDLPSIKKSIDMYKKILEKDPDNYEANWKCARAYRNYGEQSQHKLVEGWVDICAEYGKEGMAYALKAIELEPDKVEGHYYYGLCVGVYADGVSVITAIRENLKGKTQAGFERAYAIDKMYDEGGPILALGRFWAVLPWPLKKKKKALEYLREYEKTQYFAIKPKGKIYLADLLVDIGGDENMAEAKELAKQVSMSEVKFFREWAERLLAEMK